MLRPIDFSSVADIYDDYVRAHLAEGGEFICTLHNPKIRAACLNGNPGILGTFPVDADGSFTVMYRLDYDKSSGIVHGFQFYEFSDRAGKPTGKSSLEVNFRLLEREEFEILSADAGFVAVDLYGDYDYSGFDENKSPFMIWRLKAVKNPEGPIRHER